MSDWIKLCNNTSTKPEVFRMAAALGLPRAHVLGGLAMVWSWVDQHTVDGRIPQLHLATLDAVAETPGLGAAMIDVGWLVESPDGLTFPRIENHITESAKQRSLDARRKATARKTRSPAPASTPPADRTGGGRSSAPCPTLVPPRTSRTSQPRGEHVSGPSGERPPASGQPADECPDGIRTEGGQEPELDKRERRIDPPPPLPPPADDVDGWQAAAAEMVALGLEASPWGPLDQAQARGTDPATVRAGIGWFREHAAERGYGPGALARWVATCGPGTPADKGWPQPDPKVKARQAAQQLDQETRQRRHQQEAKAEASRQRSEALEARYGPTLDTLPAEVVQGLADELGPFASKQFRRQGRDCRSIRGLLLGKLEQQSTALRETG